MKAVFSVIFYLAWTQMGYAQYQNFHWLVGTWKMDGKSVYEVWTVQSGKASLLGRAFEIAHHDTTVTEVISLKYYDGSYHYIPDVAGDQPPIDFRISQVDGESFVAENHQHDFPKIIRYRRIKDTRGITLQATIEGPGKIIAYSFLKLK